MMSRLPQFGRKLFVLALVFTFIVASDVLAQRRSGHGRGSRRTAPRSSHRSGGNRVAPRRSAPRSGARRSGTIKRSTRPSRRSSVGSRRSGRPSRSRGSRLARPQSPRRSGVKARTSPTRRPQIGSHHRSAPSRRASPKVRRLSPNTTRNQEKRSSGLRRSPTIGRSPVRVKPSRSSNPANRNDTRRNEIRRRPAPQRSPGVQSTRPAGQRLGVVTNPQGLRISPNVANSGAARLLPSRRVSPKTRIDGGVALRPRSGTVGARRLGTTDGIRRSGRIGVNEQKSRRRIGGGLGRPDYTDSGNHGYTAGNSFGINIQLGRQGHHDSHYYGSYGHDTHDYVHHDYGHHYTALGHSFGGHYYPSHTYGYSSYYSPYYSGRSGFGFGLRLGGLNLGYSNYSYGYPGYYCSSSYYPFYNYYSAVSYTPNDYDYFNYPAVYTPVDYPTYIDESLEPVIPDEDDEEEDGVLDEVNYDPFEVDFDDPFGLSQDFSGYWIGDYTYAWPNWDWCGTFTLDSTPKPYYTGSYVLY